MPRVEVVLFREDDGSVRRCGGWRRFPRGQRRSALLHSAGSNCLAMNSDARRPSTCVTGFMNYAFEWVM